jgi:hypothetical protein
VTVGSHCLAQNSAQKRCKILLFSEGTKVASACFQQLFELAFLAPDIVREVLDGPQPVCLTSHWLKTHAFSPIWNAQRDLFKSL